MEPTQQPEGGAPERLPPPPDRLPTLTEVVELRVEPAATLPLEGPAGEVQALTPPQPVQAAASPMPDHAPAEAPLVSPLIQPWALALVPDDSEWTEQVLAELQTRIGLQFEARLREALAPALARAADSLIHDLRPELASTLRELVQEAVAGALRQRTPP